MKKIVAAVVAVVIVIGAGWYVYSKGFFSGNGAPAAAAAATSPSDTVATVNGKSIARSDLTSAESQIASQQGTPATSTDALAKFQTQALDLLIGQQVLKQAADVVGITASSTAVDAQIVAAKKQLGSDDAYQKALAAQGLTEEALRARISMNLAINAYLQKTLNISGVTATDAEIHAAYTQLTSGQKDAPALKTVRAQVEQAVIGQKQQQLINAEVQKLRAAADVKILVQ